MTDCRLLLGDCGELMKSIEAESIDSIVTDPPYGIRFMGQAWDGAEIEERSSLAHQAKLEAEERGEPGRAGRKTSAFANRSAESGAYDFSASGMVAFHEWTRLWAAEALRILKPGGHLIAFSSARTYHRMTGGIEDVGFEIRDQMMWLFGSGFPKSLDVSTAIEKTTGSARDAASWQGWETALKPAHEPMVLARKPLTGIVAANVLEHGTGAMNIGACRVGDDGRWPSNVMLTHLPECKGSGASNTDILCAPGCVVAEMNEMSGQLDDSGAARFFYVAKTKSRERIGGTMRNLHPTVKPVELMRHLVRLVTPPGGTVLDPFMGSGSTGCAAMVEDFGFVGIELEQASFDTSRERVADWAFAHGRSRPSS